MEMHEAFLYTHTFLHGYLHVPVFGQGCLMKLLLFNCCLCGAEYLTNLLSFWKNQKNITMQTIILTIGGIFWILAYVCIISKGFKDKTYGMPLIALCANISWEFIYSFVLPSSPPQLFINYLWFGLDCVIVFQFFNTTETNSQICHHQKYALYLV